MLQFLILSIILVDPHFAFCVRVIDGDTIELKDGRKVRLAEIDAPEKAQPWGPQASKFTSDFCLKKNLTITGEKKDRYGRTIAHVLVQGVDLGEQLVSNGLAWHYKRYSNSKELQKLQTEAKKKRVGLWGPPIAPWDWRRGKRN